MNAFVFKLVRIVLCSAAILAVLLLINYLLFRKDFARWKTSPGSSGRMAPIQGAMLFYHLRGVGSPLIVLESGLGSSYTKWSSLQERLGALGTVLA